MHRADGTDLVGLAGQKLACSQDGYGSVVATTDARLIARTAAGRLIMRLGRLGCFLRVSRRTAVHRLGRQGDGFRRRVMAVDGCEHRGGGHARHSQHDG